MATESLPASGMYALDNFIFDSAASIIASAPAADLYPASNLLLRLRSKRYRTTSGAAQSVDIDLGSAKLPTMLALIDLNLDTAAASGIALVGSENTSFTDSPSGSLLTWTLTPYLPSDDGGIVRWYLGDPDAGSAAAKRYWRLTMQSGIQSGAYHQLGVIWLGTYTDMKPDPGVDIDGVASASTAYSYNGAAYIDELPIERSISFDLRKLPLLEAFAKKDELDVHAGKHLIVDIHASTTDAAVKPEGAMYGLLASRRMPTLSVDGPETNTLAIQLDESRA